MIDTHGRWRWATCSSPVLINAHIYELEEDNLPWKLIRGELPPPSSHYWNSLSDLWTHTLGRRGRYCRRESRFKKMSAAYAKINKGGAGAVDVKTLTPKHRTGQCMGKIPKLQSSHEPRVRVNSHTEQCGLQLLDGAFHMSRKWCLPVLSTGNYTLIEQCLPGLDPLWSGDFDHRRTSRGGAGTLRSSSRKATGRTESPGGAPILNRSLRVHLRSGFHY